MNYLRRYDFWKLLVVLCTIVGAFGGFPEPPKLFQKLTSFQIVQWGLVAVLAYQGGAGEDPVLAVTATLAIFMLYKVVRFFETRD